MAVRVGFAGTSWWAAQALERLVDVAGLEIGARAEPAGSPRGARPQVRRAARGHGGASARDRARAARERGRRAAAPACERRPGRRRRGLWRARAAGAARRSAVRQPASLRAPAVARRRADRALADGRRARDRRRGDAARRGSSTPGPWPGSSASRWSPTTMPARSTRARSSSGSRCSPRALADAAARPPRDRPAGRRGDLRRQAHRRRPPARPGAAGTRAARPRARALAAHRRAPPARRRAAHDLAHGGARRRALRPGRSQAAETASCSAAPTAGSSCSSCSRRAGAGWRPPTGCAACAGRCPR